MHFQKFPKKRTSLHGISKFSKVSSQKFSFFCYWNFQNVWLNGSHSRNSTVLTLSGNFPRNFLYRSPPFLNFRKFRLNESAYSWPGKNDTCATVHERFEIMKMAAQLSQRPFFKCFVSSVPWPLDRSEAEGDLAILET